MKNHPSAKRSSTPSVRIKGLKSKHVCADSIEIRSDSVVVAIASAIIVALVISNLSQIKTLADRISIPERVTEEVMPKLYQ
jgi:hypothetical protein